MIRGHYLATSRSWSSTACCGGAANGHIGWAYRDAQLSQWAAPGVSGAADLSSLLVGDLNITGTYGYAVKAVQSDPRIVQQWIASPSQNNGILFTMATAVRARLLTSGFSLLA